MDRMAYLREIDEVRLKNQQNIGAIYLWIL